MEPLTVYLDELRAGISVSKKTELDNIVLLYQYGECNAIVGCGTTTVQGNTKLWATVYRIFGGVQEDEEYLLASLRDYYVDHGYDFGFSFGETTRIKGMLYKLDIPEREHYVRVFTIGDQ